MYHINWRGLEIIMKVKCCKHCFWKIIFIIGQMLCNSIPGIVFDYVYYRCRWSLLRHCTNSNGTSSAQEFNNRSCLFPFMIVTIGTCGHRKVLAVCFSEKIYCVLRQKRNSLLNSYIFLCFVLSSCLWHYLSTSLTD